MGQVAPSGNRSVNGGNESEATDPDLVLCVIDAFRLLWGSVTQIVIRFAGLFAIWQSACIRPKQSCRPRDRQARAPKVLVPELVPELSWLGSAVCRSHRHDHTGRANDDADGRGARRVRAAHCSESAPRSDSMQPARKVASVVDAFEALRSAAIRDSKYDLQGGRRCCSVIEGPTRNRISATGASEFAEDHRAK